MRITSDYFEILPGIYQSEQSCIVNLNEYTYHSNYNGVKLLSLDKLSGRFRFKAEEFDCIGTDTRVYSRYGSNRGCLVIYKGKDIYAVDFYRNTWWWDSKYISQLFNYLKLLDLVEIHLTKERQFFLRNLLSSDLVCEDNGVLIGYPYRSGSKYNYLYYEKDNTINFLLLRREFDNGQLIPGIDLITKELKVYIDNNVISTGVYLRGNLATLKKTLDNDITYNKTIVSYKCEVVFTL